MDEYENDQDHQDNYYPSSGMSYYSNKNSNSRTSDNMSNDDKSNSSDNSNSLYLQTIGNLSLVELGAMRP